MKSKILTIVLVLLILAFGSTTFAGTKPTANQKILKDFKKHFNSTDIPSITSINFGYILNARIDEQKISSAYNLKGEWIYTIKSYVHNNMDGEVMQNILNNYINYQIKGMDEVSKVGEFPYFIVYLQNKNSIKTVVVTNDNLQEVKEFKKI